MKSSAFLLLLAATGTGFAEVAVVPERFPLDRYSKLMNEAPFAVKTDVEPQAAPKIDWAESLYLSGASKFFENGNERDWVYINHKSDPSGGFQLYGTEANGQGIQIVKLDWHPENPAKTEVTLKKGTEFATLKRDQAAFAAPAMPQPGVVRQPIPAQIPGGSGAIRPPVVQPRTAIPRPGGNAIPAPQQTYPQPAAGAQPNQATQQGNPNDRRRIRVINSR